MFKRNVEDKILIDIDVLYDVRLAILEFLFSDNKDMIFDTDAYLERKRDKLVDFYKGIIPSDAQQMFDEELALNEVLYFRNGALMTSVLETLVPLIREEYYSIETGGDSPKPSIVVNFLNYNFTREEKDMVVRVIKEYIHVPIEVSHCSVSGSFLDAKYIRTYSRWLTYNFNKWATDMVDSIRKHPFPATEVTTGFIALKLTNDDGSAPDFAKEAKAAATGMSPVVSLNYIPLSEFSISLNHLGKLAAAIATKEDKTSDS